MKHIESNQKTDTADLRGSLNARGSILSSLAAVLAVLAFVPVAAGAEAPCPNEQLRVEDHSTTLPDCRAYEQVSPPFKDGQTLQLLLQDGIGTDGEVLSYHSIGEFGEPGYGYGHPGASYVARRGATGWASTPVNLSRTQFQGVGLDNCGEVCDFSGDLSESLQFEAPVSSTSIDKRIYRVPVGVGSEPVEVGPTIEPARAATFTPLDVEEENFPQSVYDGASGNLEHVFFELENDGDDWFWNGDTTTPSRHSLYEYTGTGNTEPELVGVRGGLGSKELVGQCGVVLGAPVSSDAGSEDSYNAVSENGDMVFFTALTCEGGPAVNELYARIDRSETVAISEPSKEDCGMCDTSKVAQEAAPKGALFQGANQEGTKVFFLSEQELLPGAKGENLYEYDFDAPEGEKVSLVAPEMAPSRGEPGGVARVSKDGTFVYLVSEDSELAGNKDAKGRTAREAGEAGEGSLDLYAFNTISRRLVFIGALSKADAGDWYVRDVRNVEATPDGRFVIFPSRGDLTPGAEGPYSQLYRYDAQSGEEEAQAGVVSSKSLVRVSIGQQSPGGYFCPTTGRVEAGFDCNGNYLAGFSGGGLNAAFDSYAHPQPSAITEDGSVFFTGTGGLTPQASNDKVVGCTEEEGGVCKEPFNPTSCSSMAVSGTLVSTQGTRAGVSSPFQAADCQSLGFKPVFTALVGGKASKAGGAGLTVRVAYPSAPQGAYANIRSVKVDLPKQLPSRLTTLQKACVAATFEANPASCPSTSDVGTATATTPLLAGALSGPAYIVSHGGEAFPDLEIVLQGEGITLVLDGNTDIKKGITSSTFKSIPDAPVSGFELKLPTGKYSILSANVPEKAKYSLCGQALSMPTVITAQNGAVIKQATKIAITGCPKAKKTTKNKKKTKKGAGKADGLAHNDGRKS